MPKPMGFGDDSQPKSAVCTWEIAHKKTSLLSLPKVVLRTAGNEIPVELDLKGSRASFTSWAASVTLSRGGSLFVELSSPPYSKSFYILRDVYEPPILSHPEVGSIRSTINGVGLDLTDIGQTSRREAWRDSDTERKVIGFIDVHRVDNPTHVPMLVWLTYVLGRLSHIPSDA